jgi:uncharacterized protein (DUF305 family)
MYKRTTYLLGSALVLVALSACGQPATTTNPNASSSPAASASDSGMAGMDHSNMSGMSPSPMPSMSPATMPGMDHGNMDHGGMMGTATADAPYDAQFIDSMIEHHQGAITMAQDALQQSQRPEIRQLAEAIIRDQQKEIEQMQAWRQEWFPDLAPTGGMGMDMGDMTVGGDPNQPYDQRFIAAMIAHHNGAIEMARDALTNAERPEIRQLAEGIIKAQEAEIAQMQEWNRQWFGG